MDKKHFANKLGKNASENSSLPGRQASKKPYKNEGTAMVLYFTGTGNSRYLARRIAEGLDMPLYDLNTCIKAGDTAPVQTGQDVVLVTPTYAWRIPRVVPQWLGKTALTGAERIWFVMDCGSEIGNAAKYNRQLAAQKHLRYMGAGHAGHQGQVWQECHPESQQL